MGVPSARLASNTSRSIGLRKPDMMQTGGVEKAGATCWSPVREAKKAVFGKSSSARFPVMKRGSP